MSTTFPDISATTALSHNYLPKSWIDPRAVLHRSPISGYGLFAQAPFAQGELVVIWGGRLFTEAERRSGVARELSLATLGRGIYLGCLAEEPVALDEYMNHSCEPNVWLNDEVTLVTSRPIAIGEELTIDYALWETEPDWQMPCLCGAPSCRSSVTGNDWRLDMLQARYGKHFSPYVLQLLQVTTHAMAYTSG